jgi:chitin synthase
VYVGWMIIYLISLPIWNFVLPMYAFWHFDDFSWGDTRKVEGVKKDTGHGGEGGTFDSSVFTMKKWSEFEMERRAKYAQEHNMPRPRFVEHDSMQFDIFKENEMSLYRRYSDVSNGSAQIPLTQLDYDKASTPLGIIPDRIQLTDGPLPSNINEVMQAPDDSKKAEHADLDWIQQSTQHNNWANPAPHHGHLRFEDDDEEQGSSSNNS